MSERPVAEGLALLAFPMNFLTDCFLEGTSIRFLGKRYNNVLKLILDNIVSCTTRKSDSDGDEFIGGIGYIRSLQMFESS